MAFDLEAVGDDNESYVTASVSQHHSVTDMISTVASENQSNNDEYMRTSAWPLSYGHSISMLSSSPSLSIGNRGTASASKSSQEVYESSVAQPFIGDDHSASSVKLSFYSFPEFSNTDLPTPNRQCSTMQAGFNGIYQITLDSLLHQYNQT
ncbi:hypothetical protein TIFTF001_052229 [Ficus carica]|uniref:Uncharacterized protein n=1 Tax=Ficus carica TaxID=3494 RepID=A0AA88JGU5_FICCA|nr:hypothetical protein TIFTF001_052229 [Ficus carica]